MPAQSSALQGTQGVLPGCSQSPRFTLPNFRVPLIPAAKGAGVLGCEAAVAPPLSPSPVVKWVFDGFGGCFFS